MLKALMVVGVLTFSSAAMAFAWLGHLRFFAHKGFWAALFVSWLIAFPEYLLNVSAMRFGQSSEVLTGAQMGTINLSTGVICIAMVSRFVLHEAISPIQWLGFGVMILGVILTMDPFAHLS